MTEPTIDQIEAKFPRLTNGIELLTSIIRRVFIAILEDGGLDPSDPAVQRRYKDHAVLVQLAAFATVVGSDAETVEQITAKIGDKSTIGTLVGKLMPQYMEGAEMATTLIGNELNRHAADYLKQVAEAYKTFMVEHPSGWDKMQANDAKALATFAEAGL